MNCDTIALEAYQYKVVSDLKEVLDIEIIDEQLLRDIEQCNSPIFKIQKGESSFVAKGNNILSSSVPINCDYQYPLDQKGRVILNKNVLSLRKVTQ